jgi:PBP1b-binding outer membrane lipoprotein LpoB
MKKIKILSIIGTFMLLFLFSCDNEPVDSTVNLNPVTPSLPISFKVSFSGKTYTTSLASAVFIDGNIIINAFRGDELESFSMDIMGNTVGDYPTNENEIAYRASVTAPLFVSVNPADEVSDTGKITITSINTVNKRISGTFNFTGYSNDGSVTSTKEFTNGVFTNIPYTTD